MAKSLTSSQISDVQRKVLLEKKKMANVAKEYNVSPKTINRFSFDENTPPNQQSTEVRKQQINLTVQQKRDILTKIDKGEKTQDLAVKYSVDPSTIRRIKTSRSAILKRAQELDDSQQFKQLRAAGVPVTGDLLKLKALEVNKIIGGPSDFKASNGWLDHFKKTYGIRQLSMQGEKLSSDTTAADEFKIWLQNHLRENGYEEDQVYNADETGAHYKSLPKKTLAAGTEKQASGFKELKERVTVMCCANASGTHKITPLIIGKSKNPKCFAKFEKEKLPVTYMNSPSAWMDRKLFMDWFKDVFIKEVHEKHPEGRKVLLLLDNAPSHPPAAELNAIDDTVQVLLFLPANVTALIQPMDQGVIEKMKRMFRKKLLRELILQQEGESIIKLAKKQTVKDCCYQIASSWDLVTEQDLRNSVPEYADCTFEVAKNWIVEDYQVNGWKILDVQEIYERFTSSNQVEGEDLSEENSIHEDEESSESLPKEISTEEAFNGLMKFRAWFERRFESTSTHLNNIQELMDITMDIYNSAV
ncbi:jerky protein homolog-like [Phymastichus coffea]|uniref:jerky protein homolog-like n=1 Tax=Phymastichus coffea TaxID=108790 RepID=UPI00273B5677|nr:jerky protein homolog-like [Phymastichus coffea]